MFLKTIHIPPTPTSRRTGDISEQKCSEYAQYASESGYTPSIMPRVKHSPNGDDDFNNIVGSTFAERGDLSHMVIIGFQTNSSEEIIWECGGSLISENYVLTAAHCLENRFRGPAKFVRVGITDITDNLHPQERTVVQTIYHPEYKKRYHDIGLLKLSEKIEFDTYARPACLHTVREIPNKRVISCGWGNVNGQRNKDLLKFGLETFDVEICNKTFKSQIYHGSDLAQGILDDFMICAGSTKNSYSSCQGDSGNPLQINHESRKHMYRIVGVTSFGKACFVTGVPSIYTRVYAYLKWIEDTLWPVKNTISTTKL